MKKTKILISVLFLLTLLLPVFHQVEAARVAVIDDVTGDVYIKKGNGTREFKAKKGMSLSEGDSVRTVKKSTANIVYDDGSKATVAPNSKVSISKLKDKANGNQTKMKVVSGKVWNSVRNLSNANDEYEIETPTAVMGVRGTLFLVSTDPVSGRTTLSVLDGRVGTSNNRDDRRNDSQNDERLVNMNQTLDQRGTQQDDTDVMDFDAEEFVEDQESEILSEVIRDITDTIEERQELIRQRQQQEQQLRQALEDAKRNQALLSIQRNVLNRLDQTDANKRQEVERLLEQKRNETIDQMNERLSRLNDENSQLREQLEERARQAGMTRDEIDEIGSDIPDVPSEDTDGEEASPESGGSSGGGGGSDDDNGSTPTPPFKQTLSPKPGEPLEFSNGVIMDFDSFTIDPNMTVTIIEKQDNPSIKENIGARNLKPVGKIIDFTFEDSSGEKIEINQPVTISIPITDTTAKKEYTSIYYLEEDNNWERQQSTISSDGRYAIATVYHFSIYGVLEAKTEDKDIISLKWVIGDGELTNSPQSFFGVQDNPLEILVNVQPGPIIQNGVIESKRIAILMKVPNSVSNKIAQIYNTHEQVQQPTQVIEDSKSEYTYFVLYENLPVYEDTNISIPSEIIFNEPGVYSGFEVIAVEDPIDEFSILPGKAFAIHSFTIETIGNTGEDIEIQLTPTNPQKSQGDFEYELLSIDSVIGEDEEELDKNIIESINLLKEGNNYRIWIDKNEDIYTARILFTIKITGIEGSVVDGKTHVVQILDAGDLKNVVAIDGEEVSYHFD